MQSPGCFDSKIRGRAPRGQADSCDSRKQSVCVQLYLSHLLDKNALRAICQRSQCEADWSLRPAALRGLRSLSAPDTPRQRRRNAARIVFQHSSHVHDSFALRWPGCAFYLATEKVYLKGLLVFSLLAPVHPEHFARNPHGARTYRTLTVPSHASSPIIPIT